MNVAVLPAPVATGRERHRFGSLDAVRGVAAVVVVLHHCLLTMPAFSDHFFHDGRPSAGNTAEWLLFDTPARILWAGYEAVILFYVLSGFVLALPWVTRRPPSFGTYAIKRVCRIYLPYIAAVAAAALCDVLLAWREPINGLGDWFNHMNWSQPVNARVLLHHVAMTGEENHIDGPIHSLVWEMRVSLLFPFIIVPMVRRPLLGTALVLAVLALVVGLVAGIWHGHVETFDTLNAGSGLGHAGRLAVEIEWTAYFAVFFVAGAFVALHLGTILRTAQRLPASIDLLLLAVGLFMIQSHWGGIELWRDLVVGAGSVLVILAALLAGRVGRALSRPVFEWLGEISYSLYLVHVPVLFVALILLHRILPLWAILVGVPPVAIAAAALFHHVVARPSVRLGQTLALRWSARRGSLRADISVPSHGSV